MKIPANFSPRRILVCQQRQLGDVLLATPLFSLLRKHFPKAELHLFTEEKCTPLILNNPDIDRVHAINKKLGLFSQIQFYRDVARHHFDLILDLQQLPRCRMMTFFSHATIRISFPFGFLSKVLYTHLISISGDYASEKKISLLSPFGIQWNKEKPVLVLTEEEKNSAKMLLQQCGFPQDGRLITIDSTHRRATKRWPAQNFAVLMKLLYKENQNFFFLLLRGPGEEEDIATLRDLCLQQGIPKKNILIPGNLPDIRLSAACIGAAILHIGHCSAPRHIAVALDTPTVVIPGASDTSWCYPSNQHKEIRHPLPCFPCGKIQCDDPQCLTLVTPEEVFSEVKKILKFE